MVILSKKRIQIVTSCVIIGLLAFSFQVANQNKIENEQSNNTVPTVSTPVSGKTIVVDAGHRSS